MKHHIVILLILLLIAMQPTRSQTTPDNTRVIELDRGWNFAAEGDSLSYPAVVPGTVHADLLRNGLLDDPFYGTNEEKVAWVETKGWSYTTTFTVDADDLARYSCARLIFEGLDTFARIVLNGEPVMQTDNMFVAWEKEVRDKIVAGKNTLTVHFTSPLKSVEPIYRLTGIDYPADNDRSTPHLSAYARKAPYHYGWDWGIRLVGCGIWRPARLVLYDGCRIDVGTTKIPLDFFVEARKVLESIRPDILMISESNCPDDQLEAFDVGYSPYGVRLMGIFEGKETTAAPPTMSEGPPTRVNAAAHAARDKTNSTAQSGLSGKRMPARTKLSRRARSVPVAAA